MSNNIVQEMKLFENRKFKNYMISKCKNHEKLKKKHNSS